MKQVVLILKNEKPQLINVGDYMQSITWRMPDGTDSELEIELLQASTRGDGGFACFVATNIAGLSPAQIRNAFETASQNS